MLSKWNDYKNDLRKRWPELTDGDLDRIGGDRDALVGRLQDRYNLTRDQAERQADEYVAGVSATAPTIGAIRSFQEAVKGRDVIASDGHSIGEVTDVIFDTQSWRVESLQVKLEKEIAEKLDVARGMFRAGTLQVPVHMVQSVGDKVLLSVASGDLRQVLTVTRNAA